MVNTEMTTIGSIPITLPIIPGNTMSGMNATMLVRILNPTGVQTSRVPITAACIGSMPGVGDNLWVMIIAAALMAGKIK